MLEALPRAHRIGPRRRLAVDVPATVNLVGALAKYLAEKDALHAGRKPRPDADALRRQEMRDPRTQG